MTTIDRPEGMNPSAATVFDMMSAIACDSDITTGLLEDELMHPWIIASLFQVLSASELALDIELVDVRTCNYPISQYDQNLNLPNVNYRSTLCLRAGSWLFDSDSLLAPTTQSGMGFSAFPDEASVIARETARRFNPAVATWHHHIACPRGASYVGPKTPDMVAHAIRAPLALYLAAQMQRATPDPSASQVSGPRF